MLFKDVIDSPCGLRYMAENLEIQSPAGRRALMRSPMLRTTKQIVTAYAKLQEFTDRLVASTQAKSILRTLRIKLTAMKDSSATIKCLAAGEWLGEVELFEIKRLAIIAREIKALLRQAGILSVRIPDLADVIRMLDPDNAGTETFYIYDSYDRRLVPLRKKIRDGQDQQGKYLAEIREIEAHVCRELSQRLKPLSEKLAKTFRAISETDLLLAKAIQVAKMALVVPTVSENGTTCYKGFFHPEVKDEVEAAGNSYQKIDIAFGNLPVTVIGANMGGKTVILRSVALAQYLFQFGFGIPASSAEIPPVDSIHLRIGDAESGGGLSSFGNEVKGIGSILRHLGNGKRHVVLLDEPARTTNPIEGAALVSALVDMFGRTGVQSIVTTHYNLPEVKCRRIKVKGLTKKKMDYRLTEVDDGRVPHEAIAVARMMGVNRAWLDRAEGILKSKAGSRNNEKTDK